MADAPLFTRAALSDLTRKGYEVRTVTKAYHQHTWRMAILTQGDAAWVYRLVGPIWYEGHLVWRGHQIA